MKDQSANIIFLGLIDLMISRSLTACDKKKCLDKGVNGPFLAWAQAKWL